MNNAVVFSSYRLMHMSSDYSVHNIYIWRAKKVAVTVGSNVCFNKKDYLGKKGLNKYWIYALYTYIQNFSSESLRDA